MGLALLYDMIFTQPTLKAVAWSGSLLAAVGVSSTDGRGAIVTSPDGVTWTAQSPGTRGGSSGRGRSALWTKDGP